MGQVQQQLIVKGNFSAVDSWGAGGARAPPEFGGSEKGQSLISAYRSLAITSNTPGFRKVSTALTRTQHYSCNGFRLFLTLCLVISVTSGKSRKRHLQSSLDYLSVYKSFDLSPLDLNIARMLVSFIW